MYSLNLYASCGKSTGVGIDLAVHKLIDQLKSFFCVRGIDAYLVGGFLRDIYLGRKPEDIDIAVESSGFDAAARLAEELDGHFVLLDDICQIARIVLHGSLIDNTGIKHIDLDNAPNGIMLDLARRDFTVNAMAFPLSLWGDNSDINSLWCHIIDPYQGIDAIASRQIKAVSGQVFKQDPLRLLRGLRLGAQLGFDIEASTLRLMHKQSNLLSCTAEERIRNELLAIFDLQNTSQVIQQLEKTGVVEYLLPELAACKGVQQPREHHWDVFGHSVNCIDSVDLCASGQLAICDNNVIEYIPWPKISRVISIRW
jgi:tRNA nucleotidyltransferase/poly(A) polymerase